VSVIVPARDEARTIARVVRNAKGVDPRTEVIVVANGSNDATAAAARRAGARVVRYREALGHDVGRAIGARAARGDILVFADADFVLPASTLRSFVRAVRGGRDVVLNRYSGFADERNLHSTSEAKRLLNRLLGRSDLVGSSMTAVPHAIRRDVAERIGFERLAVPPLAQTAAISAGFSVERGRYVPVAELNRRRKEQGGAASVERLILGDHAEAIGWLTDRRGSRAGFTDLGRRRELIDEAPAESVPPLPSGMDPRLSVVIVARNEEETIRSVIQRAKRLYPEEIVAVVNGSTDRTAEIAKSLGARVIEYAEPLGHDVGRAIGAKRARGEVLLFLDGDIAVDPDALWPYVAACRLGADIALNDLNPFYVSARMIDSVSMAKRFLNRMAGVPGLGFASLTAVPHAMTRAAAERIGFRHLAVPPLAQAIAVANGLTVKLAPGVDVFGTNRKRETNTDAYGENVVEQLILGDHAEAIRWLQTRFGARIRFPDVVRKRELCGMTRA